MLTQAPLVVKVSPGWVLIRRAAGSRLGGTFQAPADPGSGLRLLPKEMSAPTTESADLPGVTNVSDAAAQDKHACVRDLFCPQSACTGPSGQRGPAGTRRSAPTYRLMRSPASRGG